MRAKGKERQLTDAEAQNQYKQQREEELRCELLHQQIQARKRILEQAHARYNEEPKEPVMPQTRQLPEWMQAGAPMPRSNIIRLEDPYSEESEDKDYRRCRGYNPTGRSPMATLIQHNDPTAV